MTYDPPHHSQPPRQGRWPAATPAEPWQAYREDETYHPYGVPAADPYGVPAAADRQGSHRATASVGSRSQPGYAAARGSVDPRYAGHQPSRAPDPLPSPADPFPGPTTGYASGPPGKHSGSQHGGNQHGADQHGADQHGADQDNWDRSREDRADSRQSQWSTNGWQRSDQGRPDWAGNSYRDAGTGDGQMRTGYPAQADYPMRSDYGTQVGYDMQTGYGDGFDGAQMGQDHGTTYYGYADTAQGYGGVPAEYAEPDGYGVQDEFSGASGYTGTRDNFGGAQDVAEASRGYYRDPDVTGAERPSAGTVLTAPDAGAYPEGWQAFQEHRQESKRRGLIVGAMTGFLATATASAVSILAAAFVRPQASPILAAYDAFTDRMPGALKDLTAHFGSHERDVLLVGLCVSVALLGLVIGLLARHAAALGVAGLATLSVLGAFVAITRPQGQVVDVLPAVAGGLAGVVAMLWLIHASAPILAPRQPRDSDPRRGRR